MSDLIRREDVLGACIEEAQKARRYQFGQIWELNYYEIKEAINSIPTVEPKVGKWIRITQGLVVEKYACSVCGRIIEDGESEALLFIKYPYCHCGAKMERKIGERKKITIEHNICPKPECGDEFPIPKEGWKGVSDEYID